MSGLGFTVTLVGPVWHRGIGGSQGSSVRSLKPSRTGQAVVPTSSMLQQCLVVGVDLVAAHDVLSHLESKYVPRL
jgi:hypothetical protein